jgi:hypothetical protein
MINSRTSDIYYAAALLALGAKLEETDRTDPRHMQFYFSSETIDLEILEVKWANRELVVNAFDYSEAIKRMKSLVHSG